MQTLTTRLQIPKSRYNDLQKEREPIDDELEFYRGKPLPPALQARVDASDAKLLALVDVFRTLEAAVADVVSRYRCQRVTFGKMWSGAPPGASACEPPACARG